MNTLFSHEEFDNHQQVVFCSDEAIGLKAIIAIHNTMLGPSLGGCRMYPYASEADALTDVLRLSRGMTHKSAIAGLPLGGGKSVIIGDPRKDKHSALIAKMGEFVDTLGGGYIVAEDSGTTQKDMGIIRQHTRYVAGVTGDPSPFTARGVYQGIKAAVKHHLGRSDLDGIKVAIQGVGNVGYHLAELLHAAGASLWVTDVFGQPLVRAADELNAVVVEPDEIFDQDVDVFAPCAMGSAINDQTIKRLRASIIAGAANNQLAGESLGRTLHERGILYAPDYVINAGGVIAVWYEYSSSDTNLLPAQVDRIYETLTEIFSQAQAEHQSTHHIAAMIASSRLNVKPLEPNFRQVAV